MLKEGGRTGSAGVRARRWTGVLMVAELTLTVVLLAGAGFMIRNFLTMYRLDLGIDTSRLLTMNLALPERKYPAVEQRLAFYEQLEQRLKANPRIESVTITSSNPMQGGFLRRLEIDGKPLDQGQQAPNVTMLTISPQYFKTIALPLHAWPRADRRRRHDRPRSHGDQPAICRAALPQRGSDWPAHHAEHQSPGRCSAGRRHPDRRSPPPSSALCRTSASGISTCPIPIPIAYLPFRTDPRGFMTLLVRSQGDPTAMTPILREEVRAIDADLPLFGIRTLDENLAQARWPFRVFGSMFGVFALIALTLSAVGLYAVTAYAVSQRTQEIGIRMALGAQGNDVSWLFLRRSFVQLAIGLTLGVAGAFGVGQLFARTQLLVQNTGSDPITIGGIAILLAAVAIAASVLPAKRATRLDPLIALRRD